ncbi:sigma-70 family RNA polymerase sigma factor [Altererythrobacter xixiisoli]|uniref:Sigma-70 family RNA polymerase sigma factor n=1 Tax=Croceibacterium xixiisoli TaxID=1476466 RepID=A0A6I4TWS4_9SPHN|nr:sigma-70 family RNA polymerase sigma factor [Croceibacterium xixiisoli]MXO99571.1 sigma-70 family RNA polymerase sigma factor [Croceibacterium xixiisoli]
MGHALRPSSCDRCLSDSGITPFVRDHQHALVASVERRVRSRSDAEDIVQEAWIRALAQLAEAEPQGKAPIRSLKAYLHRIAANLSIDHLRRRKVRAHLEAGSIDAAALEVAGDAPLADAQLLAAEQQKIFVAALRQLPARARRVLVLSRVEGWTYPRIAAELNISVRTVSNDLERAIGQCLILLAGYES